MIIGSRIRQLIVPSLALISVVLWTVVIVSPAVAQMGPKARAVVQGLSPQERKLFFALPRSERRVFVREKLRGENASLGGEKNINGSGKAGGWNRGNLGGYEPKSPPVRVTPDLYFVDAHSQMDQYVDEERVLSLMDHGGVYRTILSHHRRRDWEDVPKFAKQHPDRIVPAVRIKGRGYHHRAGASVFYDRLSRQVGSGLFRAMAEVHLWHDSDGGKYQEIRTEFDNDLVKAAFKEATSKGWPFIIHIEFASLSTSDRQLYFKMLDDSLPRHLDHPFVLIHMAQLEAGPVRKLLDQHHNLHFMMSHASPFYQGGGKPFINMFENGTFKAEWTALIADYPDRFIFALDNVFARFWMPNIYLGKMDFWWRALSALPDEQAHAIAHGNAERLWRLAPKPNSYQVVAPWDSLQRLGQVVGSAP
ncbi:amidohydrolase [Alphaproteobacteria bacterium]|nr:amidohydrolase [Alphaproteobacteria bacterium]